MKKPTTTLQIALLGWTAVFSSSGCNDSGLVSTGLPRDSQLQILSAEQIRSACIAMLTAPQVSDEVLRGQCATNLAAAGASACAAQLESCVTQTKAQVQQQDNTAQCDDTASSLERFAGCAATVGELEDCMSSVLTKLETSYLGSTCEKPKPRPSGGIFDTPACTTFLSKCPGLIESDSASPSAG